MRTFIALLVAGVFLALSGLHVYWALGGKTPGGAFIPEVAGRRAFTPGRGARLAVAVALSVAALLVLARSGLLPGLPAAPVAWACGLLGAAFVLRAIGEFRLVGFFKTVRGTEFASMDTWVYSPLCLVLGVAVLWLTATR